MDGYFATRLLRAPGWLKRMVKILSGTTGTVPELLKKFRLGKGLDNGTFNWYASLATRPIVPVAMLR
jgi:hypothetical protein